MEVSSKIILETLFSQQHPKVWDHSLQENYQEIFTQFRLAHFEVFGATFDSYGKYKLGNAHTTISQLANVIKSI